jgi:hypothetical protein
MPTPAYPYNSTFEEQHDPDRAQLFTILKLLRGVHTATLVQVNAVRADAGPRGVVDVTPLVEDTTTAGVLIPQTPIYNVPYFRYQGGSSAVVLDPVVGDIGLAIFAEADITTVKATLGAAAAATTRNHSTADALYLGGMLNGAPTQWVKFLAGAAGIDISTPGALTLEGQTITLTAGATMTLAAPGGLTINADVTLNGTMSGTVAGAGAYQFAGTIVAPDAVINGVTQSTHVHTDPQGGNTGGPHN